MVDRGEPCPSVASENSPRCAWAPEKLRKCGRIINMRKATALLLLAMSIWLLASACAPAAPAPTPTPVPAAAPTAAPATPKPAAAAPTTPPATPKPAPMTVKVSGVAGSLADSGIFIAQANGYFAEQGLNIDYVPTASAADVIASLATGDLDVSGGGWNLGLANAILRGVPIKVVADKMSKQPGFTNHRLFIRKDLYDSGQIRGVADLKGKKLAVASVAAMGVMLAPNFQEVGLTFKDVDLVPMSFPEMLTALANKSVDASAMAAPMGTTAVAQGLAVASKRLMDDLEPAPSCGAIFFSPQFAQKTDVANRFMIAYVKGLRDYNDAFLKSKNKTEIVDIVSKATKITDMALFEKMDMPGLNPDGYADKRALDWSMKYWVSTGELKEPIDIDKVVDNSFVDNALKVLGKYSR